MTGIPNFENDIGIPDPDVGIPDPDANFRNSEPRFKSGNLEFWKTRVRIRDSDAESSFSSIPELWLGNSDILTTGDLTSSAIFYTGNLRTCNLNPMFLIPGSTRIFRYSAHPHTSRSSSFRALFVV